jgi:hypothetical protein
MTTLTLELPPEVYLRLSEEANRQGKPLKIVVQEWLIERLTPSPATGGDRDKVRQALYAGGLLTELSPGLRARADSTVPLEEVEATLARAGGKPLSEIVLEHRGPKD